MKLGKNFTKRWKTGKRSKKPGKKVALRRDRVIVLAILGLVAFVFVLGWGIRYSRSFQSLQNLEPWAAELREASREQGTNYLLLGTTGSGGRESVQEMLFLNYPGADSSPHIIFLPGNLLMHRQDESVGPDTDRPESTRVRSFYTPTIFLDQGGLELLLTQLQAYLGVEIHHYVKVHYEGLVGLVEGRGGIPYHGHTLRGTEFLDVFLREEEDEEPSQRALRRAKTLYNFVEFLGQRNGRLATSRILREAAPFVETDLEWKKMRPFYEQFSRVFESENVVLTLPGTWHQQEEKLYFEADHSRVMAMMDQLGTAFMIPREMITVEVLNGSGVSGIAGRTAAYLEEEGFKVLKVDNADHQDYPRSHVISRIDDIEAAREVALHIPGAEFFKEPLEAHPAMVTVIIGKNFDL